jgi:hypothetical protein
MSNARVLSRGPLTAGTNVTISGTWPNQTVAASGGGAAGADGVFSEVGYTVNTSYTISTGKNAGSFGPITIATGAVVTIPTGSVWTII